MALEFFLPAAQDCLIGLDLVEAPADFRRSLCSHAAMLVEFNWGSVIIIYPCHRATHAYWG